MIHHLDHHIHNGGDDAHKDDAGNQQSCVVIAYVGEFMGYYPCQFVVVEQVEQSCGHRHCVGCFVDAAGKGVELWVIDNVDFGHVHSAGHAQVFHDVIHPWVLLSAE